MTTCFEKLPLGWVTAEVTYKHRDGALSSRYEMLDVRRDPMKKATRYLHRSMHEIAVTCSTLFFIGLPLYFLVYTAFQFVRTPIVSIVNLSGKAFLKQIWAIARIPIYFIGLECAALYGICNPLEGRAFFGVLESALHDGKGRRDAIQYQKGNFLQSSLTELDCKTACFVGFCLQPIGKMDDPHIIIDEAHPSLPTA